MLGGGVCPSLEEERMMAQIRVKTVDIKYIRQKERQWDVEQT